MSRPFSNKNLLAVLVIGVMLFSVLAGGCQKKISTKTGPAGTQASEEPLKELRLGYFGNLTHAQAVLGVQSGEFAQSVSPSQFSTKVFNAGPSLIEALLANEIDIAYVGPGPATSGYLRTNGDGIRILAGAAANGVLIIAGKDSGINSVEDLKGKIIATPQQGNTQDIAARYYLTHTLKQADADNIRPIENAQQSALMERGKIDAAWAPEPWGSRLVAEAGARIVGEEKDLWPGKQFILTLVITSPKFLKAHPSAVRKILEVHHHWTVRLQSEPDKYIPQLEDGLFAVNGKRLPPGVLQSSIRKVKFTDDPLPDTIATMADWAYELGFNKSKPEANKLIDQSILESIKAQDAAK